MLAMISTHRTSLLCRSRLLNSIMSASRTSCWNCGSETQPSDLFCRTNTCNAVQSIKLKDIDAFSIFGVESTYNINAKHLDTSFKQIQMQLHPDKFATKSFIEKKASSESSAAINQAYQILKSPMSRAGYLLQKTFGIDFDETKSYEDDKLMIEVFTIREEIEDAKGTNEMEDLLRKLQHTVADLEVEFEEHMRTVLSQRQNQQKKDAALHCAVRLRYFLKMIEELLDKMPHHYP
mmetsp:Transcript_32443/g.54709  ORF Transcript_32443/g.54709 Transcript_32443/m.54709 type:complete len:235 (+) Transcript_32443:68-772(+)